MSDRAHKHTFSKHQTTIDFCHYVIVQRYCKECDETVETEVERDFIRNPMKVAFADETCARCRQMLYGHEPASWKALTCSECGVELTDQEAGRCGVCYRYALEAS